MRKNRIDICAPGSKIDSLWGKLLYSTGSPCLGLIDHPRGVQVGLRAEEGRFKRDRMGLALVA